MRFSGEYRTLAAVARHIARARCWLALPALLLLNLAWPSDLAAQRAYTVVDLGSIDTSDGGYGSAQYHLDSSRGYSINNRGEATGDTRRTQTGSRNGFRWTNGKMEAQTTGDIGTIHAINEAGAVARWEESNRLGRPRRAARALVGGHDLGTFDNADVSSDSARSYATGINELGHGTGASEIGRDGLGAAFAFLWKGEFDGPRPKLINLGTLPGGYSSYATDLNDRDEVTGHASSGTSFEHAFLYSNGVMHDLGTLGGVASRGHAINNAGQVVGEAENANRVSRAFSRFRRR